MKWTNDVSVVSTAMADAIGRGDVQEVGNLLARGAPVRARGPGGVTYLHLAALAGMGEIARLLLEYEAEVGAVDDAGRTALGMAQAGGRGEVVEWLVKYGTANNSVNGQ
ncbi:MAG: ankyrin repeat domain-containing protein [Janthinobacterium lividum]